MAKACGACRTVHADGDCPMGGGRRKRNDPPKKPPRHKHVWKFRKRHTPWDGSLPWDEYYCTYPGCPATDERKV